MLTYFDFCNSCSFDKCAANEDAKRVFDFISQPENIDNMVIFTKVKLPAISGIVNDLESTFANAPLFPLKELKNRQAVGKMVKFILGHFGYKLIASVPDERARLRNFSEAKFFKTASIYELRNTPVNSIEIKIV